ncbi:MAG: sigma-54-dependent Fis family transcriptional regulator [Deltaproteobacteria bacterium]|nr:sigma-54-dependent Fis family transcriptional regulator [Deltaproteobacteria bacterium]
MHVLVVDDERNIRATLALALEADGCTVVQAGTPDAALAAVTTAHFDLAFVDLRLGTQSGLDLLPRLLAESPRTDVVMVTAFGTIDAAVEAMRRGARDFLTKPFTPAQIRHIADRSRERHALESRVVTLQAQLAEAAPDVDVELDARAPAMRAALELVRKAAEHDVAVLMLGESGTGKSVVARALHQLSARRERPFVVVNCPTLSEDLLASELFGHVKGAFTGAVRDQAGRVEAADGGTLFLDEIAEVPPSLQAKLLRFLQDKQFERLGDSRTRHADVRILAATNRKLDAEVAAGRFREDLYFRLNTVEVTLPPLRDRPEDVLPLARRFIEFLARSMRRPTPDLSDEAAQALTAYRWPGNLRELRNTLERAMILAPGSVLGLSALPAKLAGAPTPTTSVQLGGDFSLEQVEREHLLRVVARAESLDEAARILGIDASTLYRKRRRYDAEG